MNKVKLLIRPRTILPRTIIFATRLFVHKTTWSLLTKFCKRQRQPSTELDDWLATGFLVFCIFRDLIR